MKTGPLAALLTFCTLALPPGAASSAPQEPDTARLDAARLAVFSGATLATIVGVHIYQRQAWWQGERQPFRFENDWTYALNIDKFGHVFGGYLEASVGKAAFEWCGLDERKSVFFGAVGGLAYQLYVEVEDGYHKEYGFSPGDGFSDIIGASIPLAQEAFPLLKNFSMKWSYWPSSQYRDALHTQTFRVFFDDYEGQVYWIGMDPHFLMGEGMAGAVPPWLGVSFGIGVHNHETSLPAQRLYYLTADYNFSKIPTDSRFLRTLFGALDFFHFPAPGIALEGNRFRIGIFYTYNAELAL
jgi:hypothetical protein